MVNIELLGEVTREPETEVDMVQERCSNSSWSAPPILSQQSRGRIEDTHDFT